MELVFFPVDEAVSFAAEGDSDVDITGIMITALDEDGEDGEEEEEEMEEEEGSEKEESEKEEEESEKEEEEAKPKASGTSTPFL